MKILIAVSCVLALSVILVVAVGYILPVKHQAIREAEFKASPARIWLLISNFSETPKWRSDVKSAQPVNQNNEELWKEVDSHGHEILYRTLESIPEKRMTRQIASKSLPFGGSWTFEISPSPSGSRVKITENGEVYNPIFRFVSRFVFGHSATLEKYLASLQKAV
jgi:hypothetical protein